MVGKSPARASSMSARPWRKLASSADRLVDTGGPHKLVELWIVKTDHHSFGIRARHRDLPARSL
jgi:hypothetical protein